MNITLTYSGTTVLLSDRLVWDDEFSWSPVEQSLEYSSTGALIVDVGVKQSGRPITLQGTETAAWIQRALCDTLYAWAKLPGADFTLVVRGTSRNVIFNHPSGFDAVPVWKLADGEETPDQLFVPTLKFIEI